jgi:hypothetical protein
MRFSVSIAVIALISVMVLAAPPVQRKDKDGFVPLFNGKDLTGWQPATNWGVEDGIIVLKDRSDRQEHNDNYLWTQKQYGDFVLELDFKPAQGTNSGIFLRTSDVKDPVYTGIEVQVASLVGAPTRKNPVGSIYDLVQPKVVEVRPEEWSQFSVSCKGSKIAVVLNGTAVSEIDLDQFPEAGKNPDGTPNKFKKALKDYARNGYIGLQDHGTFIAYRNVRIKTLK